MNGSFLIAVVLAIAVAVAYWRANPVASTPLADDGWSEADQVFPRLFVGSAMAASDLTALKQRGIDAVLSVGTKFDESMYTGAQHIVRAHRVVRAKDLPEQNLIQFMNASNAWLQEQLARPESRVLVHCQQGKSRSASIVAAYLIATHGLSVDAAVATLKARRPIVAPNRGFLEQLHLFAEHHARQWWPLSDRYLELVDSLRNFNQF